MRYILFAIGVKVGSDIGDLFLDPDLEGIQTWMVGGSFDGAMEGYVLIDTDHEIHGHQEIGGEGQGHGVAGGVVMEPIGDIVGSDGDKVDSFPGMLLLLVPGNVLFEEGHQAVDDGVADVGVEEVVDKDAELRLKGGAEKGVHDRGFGEGAEVQAFVRAVVAFDKRFEFGRAIAKHHIHIPVQVHKAVVMLGILIQKVIVGVLNVIVKAAHEEIQRHATRWNERWVVEKKKKEREALTLWRNHSHPNVCSIRRRC